MWRHQDTRSSIPVAAGSTTASVGRVRQAFLCDDRFGHRKAWIPDRLRVLAANFAIDVCGFAAMGNHIHVVLRTDPDRAAAWSPREVARRWMELYPRSSGLREESPAARRTLAALLAEDSEWIEIRRARLSNLSWFMRGLCEPIARWANREDGCTGRFWEGRFAARFCSTRRPSWRPWCMSIST